MNGGSRRARGLFLVALSEFAKTLIMARLPGLGGIERASAAAVAATGCAVFSGQPPGRLPLVSNLFILDSGRVCFNSRKLWVIGSSRAIQTLTTDFQTRRGAPQRSETMRGTAGVICEVSHESEDRAGAGRRRAVDERRIRSGRLAAPERVGRSGGACRGPRRFRLFLRRAGALRRLAADRTPWLGLVSRRGGGLAALYRGLLGVHRRLRLDLDSRGPLGLDSFSLRPLVLRR